MSDRQARSMQGGTKSKRRPREEVLARRGLRRSLPKTKISPKFDETVDLAVRLGVDPKHADQMVRGAVVLPHGTGKTKRVIVFAKGDKAKEAHEAGADFVGADDLVDKIQKENWLDFDAAVATPDMMGLGRPDRPRPRSARPDAEPEGRHRHLRRRQGGPRAQGRSRRVQRREGGHRPRPHRQDLVRRPRSCATTRWALLELIEAQAVDGEGHVHAVDHRLDDDGPGIKIDVNEVQAKFDEPELA